MGAPQWRWVMRYCNFLLVSLAVSLLILVCLAAPARAADNGYSYVRIVRLSYVSGDVQIVRPDHSDKWEPAYANMPIQQGFTLGTNNGRAEIEFENGSAMWLAERSMIQFTDLALSDGGRITKMMLTSGTATFEADIHNGDVFVVSTSQFEVSPLSKSRFRVDAFGDGGLVSMVAGSASVNSDSGAKQIFKGETFALGAGTGSPETVKKNPARDSWDRWTNDRANYLNAGDAQTLQYTNSPFGYGMADLASYGNWMTYGGCGYGWQPYAAAGWTPFLNGQWMYYPSFGWSWVSYEPWGWTPYHFGNWINCPGNGWIWQPGGFGYWMGAPVQWTGVGKRIGWRPIRPRVDPVHASSGSIVLASKDLGKEGLYHVLPESKLQNEMKEFSTPPLADGKIPPPGALDSRTGNIIVPTSGSLAALRNQIGASATTPELENKAERSATVIAKAVPREINLVAALQNAAPHPASRIPTPPPARSFTAPPSSPGQPSYHPAPDGSANTWSAASNSAPLPAPAPAPSISHGSSAPASAPPAHPH